MLCRSGRYALMMFCFWSIGSFASEEATANHWFSKVQRTSMNDGSVLTEYIAGTPATNSGGIWLQTVFIPRFACTPLSSIRIADDHLWAHRFGNDTSFAMELSIDEKSNLLAVNLDKVARHIELSFQGDLKRRQNLQELIDKGITGKIEIDQYLKIEFSLLGSTEVHKMAKQGCLEHRATPVTDAESVQAKNP